MSRCSVKGCSYVRNAGNKRHYKLHSFPKEEPFKSEWKRVCKENVNTKTARVCSRHFEERYFFKPLIQQMLGYSPVSQRNIKADAVPTLFICHPPREDNSPYITDTSKVNNELDYVVDPPKGHDSVNIADLCEVNYAVDSIVDSVTIDHDYVATTVPRKSQNSVCLKSDQKDLSKQLTLNNVRKELCRLCGQKGSPLMPIFEPAFGIPQDMPTSSKIDMYLPIKVKVEDPLPFCICSNCLEVLNNWHELYVTCVAADAVLWKTFGSETDISSKDVNSRMLSTIRQKSAKVSIEIGTQTEQMPSVTPHENKEKKDADCAKNKTGTIQTEDKSFNEEFDKNLCNYRQRSYKCRFCFELFKCSADRKNHIAMCRQLATICELCGYKVSCRKDLKRHKYRKHNRKIIVLRQYLCDKCDKSFKSAAGLNFHIKNIHDGQDRSMKYFCELCCTAFRQDIYFRNHMRKHEKGKIKTVFQIEPFRQGENSEGSENTLMYCCPVCQEMFSSKLSLVTHLTTKKKIKCSLCHKIMSCEKRFFLHVCGQWTCQYCLKSFDTRVKWIVHERLHTGEKPIKCRVCDLTFRTWHARRRHETHHEPSYQCSYCSKSFRNKYIYQDHVSCHEGKEFLCHICNKKFSGRKGVYKHVNIFHKNNKETVCISE